MPSISSESPFWDSSAASRAPGDAIFYLRCGRTGFRTVTAADIAVTVEIRASLLRARGIRPGDRVAVLVPPSPDLYAVLLAIHLVGAVAVQMDPAMGARRMAECLVRIAAKGAVCVPYTIPIAMLARTPVLTPETPSTSPGLANRRASTSCSALHRWSAGDVAMITFTTGDAEPPKGVPKTVSYLAAQHRALTSCLGLAPTDVDLCTMPGFVMNDMAAGVPVVPVRSAVAPRLLADLLGRKGPAVSRITASPGVLDVLARSCLEKKRSFRNVRRVVTGGAAVQERLVTNLYRVFPEATVTVLYGSTEAIPIAAIDGKERLAECARETARGAGYCVGRPVDSIMLRIRLLGAPGHASASPSAMEPGEILVAGETVNPSYWNDEAATSRTKLHAPDGIVWHRTMDTGYLDGSGRLWLTGKVKHLIRSGSDTVYPLRIEGALHAIPGVRRAAVFGGPATGAAVHAALQLEPRTRARLAVEAARDAALRLGVAFSTICVLARMPLDSRHRYKIDYDRLRRIRVVKARVRRAETRVNPGARRH